LLLTTPLLHLNANRVTCGAQGSVSSV